ncbi:holo-ACP synthase [Thiorhodospira sibirica]|uniref:holo-ACP synthase n=1 Tax=Thiorhodospira sibirica TaxID=154347 RepID=UPI00022C586C|nr:holo-ACP synthase [Thiorhodospira sibirica]
MNIIGIGTDLVSIARIRQVIERHEERFAQRILHPLEWARYSSQHDPAAFLARRFALKEAVSKALGVGIGQYMSLQDAWLEYTDLGQPTLGLSGQALATAQRLGVVQKHVSLADEREFALAFVVLSGPAGQVSCATE